MKFVVKEDRIVLFDANKEIGEIVFPMFDENIRVINRTYVDPNYRSGGLASKLVQKAYEHFKSRNEKVVATCPYVVRWFNRYPEKQDIILQEVQEGLGEACALS